MMSRFRIKAHLPFPFLCDLVSHPRLLDAVEDLIGPNILCWGSSFFQKEPGDKSFVSWHQDSTYYGLEPPITLTAWIAITEASIASGCMRFLPGSQGKGVYSHDELVEKDNLLSRGQTVKAVDESRAVLRAFGRQLVNVYHGRIMFRQVITLQPRDNDTTLLLFHFLNKRLAGDLGQVNYFATWLLRLSQQEQDSDWQSSSYKFHFVNFSLMTGGHLPNRRAAASSKPGRRPLGDPAVGMSRLVQAAAMARKDSRLGRPLQKCGWRGAAKSERSRRPSPSP
jgi:Phytanoyl-CoA dioxygenase (PhyH)